MNPDCSICAGERSTRIDDNLFGLIHFSCITALAKPKDCTRSKPQRTHNCTNVGDAQLQGMLNTGARHLSARGRGTISICPHTRLGRGMGGGAIGMGAIHPPFWHPVHTVGRTLRAGAAHCSALIVQAGNQLGLQGGGFVCTHTPC